MYLIFFFFLRFFPLFQEGMTMENDIFVLIFFYIIYENFVYLRIDYESLQFAKDFIIRI